MIYLFIFYSILSCRQTLQGSACFQLHLLQSKGCRSLASISFSSFFYFKFRGGGLVSLITLSRHLVEYFTLPYIEGFVIFPSVEWVFLQFEHPPLLPVPLSLFTITYLRGKLDDHLSFWSLVIYRTSIYPLLALPVFL